MALVRGIENLALAATLFTQAGQTIALCGHSTQESDWLTDDKKRSSVPPKTNQARFNPVGVGPRLKLPV
jgi:hypothetical protein